MRVVALTSGGLDSTLMLHLARERGDHVIPLFIDYGQRAVEREWASCLRQCSALGLLPPTRMDVAGYGKAIPSGLTTPHLDVNADAFLPGRNLLLVVLAASFAYSRNSRVVMMGLLAERSRLFPDQEDSFIAAAEGAIEAALGARVAVLLPLRDFEKADVVTLARKRAVAGTYSCHAGGERPCGVCVSCSEFGRSPDNLDLAE